jgi:hypothetical protein
LTIEFGTFAKPARTSRLSSNLTSSDHHNNSVLLSTGNAVMCMLAAEAGSDMEVDDFKIGLARRSKDGRPRSFA